MKLCHARFKFLSTELKEKACRLIVLIHLLISPCLCLKARLHSWGRGATVGDTTQQHHLWGQMALLSCQSALWKLPCTIRKRCTDMTVWYDDCGTWNVQRFIYGVVSQNRWKRCLTDNILSIKDLQATEVFSFEPTRPETPRMWGWFVLLDLWCLACGFLRKKKKKERSSPWGGTPL